MTTAGPMKHVAVVGGGIVAWSAAAALKRHIPSLEVSVVSCPVPPDALADRTICTLPSISVFHEDLGLTEADTVFRAESGLRSGTIFEGWSAERSISCGFVLGLCKRYPDLTSSARRPSSGDLAASAALRRRRPRLDMGFT